MKIGQTSDTDCTNALHQIHTKYKYSRKYPLISFACLGNALVTHISHPKVILLATLETNNLRQTGHKPAFAEEKQARRKGMLTIWPDTSSASRISPLISIFKL